MSAPHPVLSIESLCDRHPGLTPTIAVGYSGACGLGAIGFRWTCDRNLMDKRSR